jgi:hypothetical protein
LDAAHRQAPLGLRCTRLPRPVSFQPKATTYPPNRRSARAPAANPENCGPRPRRLITKIANLVNAREARSVGARVVQNVATEQPNRRSPQPIRPGINTTIRCAPKRANSQRNKSLHAPLFHRAQAHVQTRTRARLGPTSGLSHRRGRLIYAGDQSALKSKPDLIDGKNAGANPGWRRRPMRWWWERASARSD